MRLTTNPSGDPCNSSIPHTHYMCTLPNVTSTLLRGGRRPFGPDVIMKIIRCACRFSGARYSDISVGWPEWVTQSNAAHTHTQHQGSAFFGFIFMRTGMHTFVYRRRADRRHAVGHNLHAHTTVRSAPVRELFNEPVCVCV